MSTSFDFEKLLEKYPNVLTTQTLFDLQTKRTNDDLSDSDYKVLLVELGITEEDAQGLIDWNTNFELGMKESGIVDFMELTVLAMDIFMSNENLSGDIENIQSLMKDESFDAINYLTDKHGLTQEHASTCAEYFRKSSAIESMEEDSTMTEEERIAFLRSQLGGE
jgi:hypothetical protein